MTDTTNQQWEFTQAGGPEVLHLVDRDPVAPGHGEVRIRVEAFSMNRSDLMFLADEYLETPVFPSRFGTEAAGTIDAVGDGVTGLSLGDRVTSVNAFSVSQYGTFGNTAIVPARAVIRVPNRFSSAQAASFGFPYLTNYFALFEIGAVKPGQVVLVTAATSTTGLAALPMIKSAGGISIATTRTNSKRDALIRAGADHVIVTDEEDLVARVMEITDGRGADLAYDPAPATFGDSVANSLAVGGLWIIYGFMTPPSTFPWWPVMGRSLRVHFYAVYEFSGNPLVGLPGKEEKFTDAKRVITASVESGSWPPVPVDTVFDGIENLPTAVQHMLDGRAVGKIVVTI